MPHSNNQQLDQIARRLAEHLLTGDEQPPKVTTVAQVKEMSAADVMKATRAGRVDHAALAADSARIEAERLELVRQRFHGAMPPTNKETTHG